MGYRKETPVCAANVCALGVRLGSGSVKRTAMPAPWAPAQQDHLWDTHYHVPSIDTTYQQEGREKHQRCLCLSPDQGAFNRHANDTISAAMSLPCGRLWAGRAALQPPETRENGFARNAEAPATIVCCWMAGAVKAPMTITRVCGVTFRTGCTRESPSLSGRNRSVSTTWTGRCAREAMAVVTLGTACAVTCCRAKKCCNSVRTFQVRLNNEQGQVLFHLHNPRNFMCVSCIALACDVPQPCSLSQPLEEAPPPVSGLVTCSPLRTCCPAHWTLCPTGGHQDSIPLRSFGGIPAPLPVIPSRVKASDRQTPSWWTEIWAISAVTCIRMHADTIRHS